jgi:hypothetical protein
MQDFLRRLRHDGMDARAVPPEFPCQLDAANGGDAACYSKDYGFAFEGV